MNKKLVASFFMLGATLVSSSSALAHNKRWDGTTPWDCMTPYVGADAQWRHMDFKKGFGHNMVKHDYPQGNIYVGVKFNDYVGIEGGYESTTSKTRDVTLQGSDDFFGEPVDAGFPNELSKFSTKTKIHGPHINIAGFLPISDDGSLQLIGSIGIAQLKIRIQQSVPFFSNAAVSPPSVIKFAKKKWLPRINVGLQQMINSQFGVRGIVGWENTSRFGSMKSTSTALGFNGLTAQVKNSLNFGLGFFYNFK